MPRPRNAGLFHSDSCSEGKFQPSRVAVQPFGHQESIVIFITGLPVKFKHGIVSAVHFEMDGIHTHFARLFLDEFDGLAAKAAPTVNGFDVQLIDERVVAMEFEAEANGQDNVADKGGAFIKEPRSAEMGKRQELAECRTGRGFVKLDFAGLLFGETAHHGKKNGFVREGSLAKV